MPQALRILHSGSIKMYTPNIKKPPILTVTQLNGYIKSLLESDTKLNAVFLSGEISNFGVNSKSGHAYFTLKDENSVIRAIMFAGYVKVLKFIPTNGMNVICVGRISVYQPSGQYQITVENMQPDGVGALTLAYEQLKEKLLAKGLFAPEHKKPLPKYPKTIGVITSPTGAAFHDIQKTLYRRYPCVDIVMCPVLVQGDGAPEQLVNAVNTLDKYNLCDVIIIGRGGGSIEDLWAFNNEELANAVYNCKIPVISAVGHEIDYTICDFAADRRAATPTAAAEIAVPDQEELKQLYRKQYQLIYSTVTSKYNQNLHTVSDLHNRLALVSPENKINEFEYKLSNTANLLSANITNLLNVQESKLKSISAKFESLNPVSVLARGYSIAEKDGKVISSKSQLKCGEEFTVEFSDGKIRAKSLGE